MNTLFHRQVIQSKLDLYLIDMSYFMPRYVRKGEGVLEDSILIRLEGGCYRINGVRVGCFIDNNIK